jgi:tetratricopeptide (TPR) repeat protein
MRGMLAHGDLARYAGQFVWLELNYDKPENRGFLTKYGANATPTFFIIDSQDGQVAATQTGAMSLTELTQFLDRGASGVFAKKQTPADAALRRGDALLSDKPEEAVKAYQEALRVAPATWSQRQLAEASRTLALQNSHQWQQCAETASREAAGMNRDAMFGRTVVAGMWCLDSADPGPWTTAQAARLEPLAKEALALPTTVRDHRDELYRTLMYLSLSRNDQAAAGKWGDRWLDELDARKPVDDEERSAMDIARVENVQTFGDPKRILPALIASERAMPHDWNASLRVAQMENAAKNYDEAIAACDRGLSRTPGAAGRSWLLRTKADAFRHTGQREETRRMLEEALQAAQAIPNTHSRDNNVNSIKQVLEQTGEKDERQKK